MVHAYGLKQVLMKDAYCVNAFEKDVAYLKSFDTGRLLAGFYENAGLTSAKMRYPGWENMLIGGHTLGHFLTAAAQACANAQVSDADREVLFGMLKNLIDALLECQAHSLGKKGFLFGAVILDKNNVELQFDYVEQNKTNIITEAWVPWYTMHKILDGILNTYRFTGYEPALKLAEGIGDWTYDRASSWSDEVHKTVLGIEYGGMNDALYDLYSFSGKKEHLIAAHLFDEDSLFERVKSGAKNVLNNLHANTTIPKFLGALNRYMTLGEEEKRYLEYTECFWDMVVTRHTYATGGNSEWEHFGEDGILDAERTNCNNETCNTYNMLKMTRKLFMITGDKKYADYYENTLINAILSSQNPETGMTMYFQPMATGYYKVYGTPFDKFWCCTGSGMENFTKLGDSIYFAGDHEVTVNLYLSSTLCDDTLGFSMEQIADFPKENTAVFRILSAAEKMTLRFRVPDWTSRACVTVNGKQYDAVSEGGYLAVSENWKAGDEICVCLPMKVQAIGLPDCENVFAFKYGPVLLSADLGTENLVDGKTGVDVTIPTTKKVKSEFLTVENGKAKDFIENIDAHFERKEDGSFLLRGTDQELTFRTHYKKTRERYGIYWYFVDGDAKESDSANEQMEKHRREQLRLESILDTVQPGYGQYENDSLHRMEDRGSVGITDCGTARYAKPGGSFTYHMKAQPSAEMLLELHLLREDNGKQLVVFIGEDKVFEKRLYYTGMEEEYTVEIKISAETAAKAMEEDGTIPVTFRGSYVVDSARVYGFVYLRKVIQQ